MKNYIPKSNKSKSIQKIINEALDILESVGIPINTKTERGLERMAVCFLAVAGVTKDWKNAKLNANLKSRDIISIVNEEFNENIASGSYDNIRRKDLKLLVLADIVINSGVRKGSATNDPTRGYALNPEVKELIATYTTDDWSNALLAFNKNKLSLSDILGRKRDIQKIPIELPRFGSDCKVLYIGDTSNKILHIDEAELKKLKFFELSHNELPDIIAFSAKNNWLYLIEAVHSSGPMSETRVFELKKILKDCNAELIFVTSFLTRQDFKKWMLDVAWETEVWIADKPDHLVHFNGHKFLGAY